MGRDISLFSGYDQRENRTTNYCILMLKILYEENPKFLSQVISILTNEDIGGRIGVEFSQQARKKSSVPDGVLSQKPFYLYLETKNFDWFYDCQLENHLAALDEEYSGTKVLLALSKFEKISEDRFGTVENLCATEYKNRVYFSAVSFEEFINALKGLEHLPKDIADTIVDFESYLDEQDLLPQWKYRLDAVACGKYPEDVLDGNCYICPARGGPYSHKRSKYFGMYRNKCVEKVATIEAVVDVMDKDALKVKWSIQNNPDNHSEFKNRAFDAIENFRCNDDLPLRVFLLGKLHDTSFKKDTPYGIQTKTYFDVPESIEGAAELASHLNEKTWTEYKEEQQGESVS